MINESSKNSDKNFFFHPSYDRANKQEVGRMRGK